MSVDGGQVRALREGLLAARRHNDPAALGALLEAVQALAASGYRCCLVDYAACRPAFYVRLVGFDAPRLRAELEFPIEPGLAPVQRVPLSHLVDYEEAEPASIRRIYRRLRPYLRQRRPPLLPAPAALPAPARVAARSAAVGVQAGASGVVGWWAVAALLMVTSLLVFALA